MDSKLGALCPRLATREHFAENSMLSHRFGREHFSCHTGAYFSALLWQLALPRQLCAVSGVFAPSVRVLDPA